MLLTILLLCNLLATLFIISLVFIEKQKTKELEDFYKNIYSEKQEAINKAYLNFMDASAKLADTQIESLENKNKDLTNLLNAITKELIKK